MKRIYDALLAEGMPPECLQRVNAPVGLDIGAVSPEEIAVAILAELIAVRRGKIQDPKLAAVSMRWDRIHARQWSVRVNTSDHILGSMRSSRSALAHERALIHPLMRPSRPQRSVSCFSLGVHRLHVQEEQLVDCQGAWSDGVVWWEVVYGMVALVFAAYFWRKGLETTA